MAGSSDSAAVLISAVVVTHNSAAVVGHLLAALAREVEIVCVDNASHDDIAGAVAPYPVKLIRNAANLGYGAACNRGAAVASGKYLFFMNPDMSVTTATLAALRAALGRYPDVAAFSPHIEDESGRVENRDHNFIERVSRPKFTRMRAPFAGDCCVHFLHGGALVIHRATFLTVGGFDERMFLYYEDDDLAARLLHRREVIIYVHGAAAVHGVQRSATPTLRRRYAMNRHKKRSEIYIRQKYGLPYHRLADIADLCLRILVYSVTLNGFRLAGAAGRLAGALSPSAEERSAGEV